MVTNISKPPTRMTISTSAGNASTNLQATLPGLGNVWFDRKGVVNVLSLVLIEDKYLITYDSSVEPAFIVHMRNGPLKFRRSAEGLYYYRPDLNNGKILVQTINDNKSFYSNRQIACAKRAWELMHKLGYPSVADLKHIIKMNAIKDCVKRYCVQF